MTQNTDPVEIYNFYLNSLRHVLYSRTRRRKKLRRRTSKCM